MASTTRPARRILICEPRSRLAAAFVLQEAAAPQACELIWRLAGHGRSWGAIHAMWTGPEISCAIPVEDLPGDIIPSPWPHENETSHPAAGELVLTKILPGPPSPTTPFPNGGLDLGVFYGEGGRLLFPGGWLKGAVVARVDPADAQGLAQGARLIRQDGACQISIEQIQ